MTNLSICQTSAAAALALAHSYANEAGDALISAAQKVKRIAMSEEGRIAISFGLGIGMHFLLVPLRTKIMSAMGMAAMVTGRGSGRIGLPILILLTPYVCYRCPIWEEQIFRGDESIQEKLKTSFTYFYEKVGFSAAGADIAARATAIFFTSVLFGLVHFGNAIVFMCNPMVFLPQVVLAVLAGVILGLAKELTGDWTIPAFMHMGNNTFVWSFAILESL